MPAVTCSDKHRIDFLAGEQITKIPTRLAVFRTVVGIDQLYGGGQPIGAGIGDCRPPDCRLPKKVRQNLARTVADADTAENDAVARSDAPVAPEHTSGHDHWRDGKRHATLEKTATAKTLHNDRLHFASSF